MAQNWTASPVLTGSSSVRSPVCPGPNDWTLKHYDEDEESNDMTGVKLRKPLSDSVEDEQVTKFDSMKLSDPLESQETDIANMSDLSEDEGEPINDIESGKPLSDSVKDEHVTGFGSMKLSDPLESQEPDIMNTSDLSINDNQERETMKMPVSHDDEEEPIVADEEGNMMQKSDSQDQGEPIVLDKEVDAMRMSDLQDEGEQDEGERGIEGSQPMIGVESSPAKSDSFDCEACSNKHPNDWVMWAKRGLLGWKTRRAKSDSFDCEACYNKRRNICVMQAKRGPLVGEIHPEFDSEEDYEMGASDSREDKEEEPVIADKEAMDSFEPRRSAHNVVAKNYSYPSIPTRLKFLSGKRKRGF